MTKKNRFNILVYAIIFIIILALFFLNAIMYEGIMQETSDYGSILNSIVISLANLFQFPSSIVLSSKSNISFLLIMFVNLNFYTIVIYFLRKKIISNKRE